MKTVYWSHATLRKISLLKLVGSTKSENWQVERCEGYTHAGERVNVSLPFTVIPKLAIKDTIVAYAKDENVYARGLEIFKAIQTDSVN